MRGLMQNQLSFHLQREENSGSIRTLNKAEDQPASFECVRARARTMYDLSFHLQRE